MASQLLGKARYYVMHAMHPADPTTPRQRNRQPKGSTSAREQGIVQPAITAAQPIKVKKSHPCGYTCPASSPRGNSVTAYLRAPPPKSEASAVKPGEHILFPLIGYWGQLLPRLWERRRTRRRCRSKPPPSARSTTHGPAGTILSAEGVAMICAPGADHRHGCA